MKKKTRKRTLVLPLLLMMFLSLLEPVLITAGILPKVFTYSIGNILFSLARFAVVAHVAFSRADEGLRTSAINGLVLGFASASIICTSGLVGTTFYGKPVLGISAGSQESRLFMIILIIIESAAIFALFSTIVTWLTRKFKYSSRPSPR